MLCSIHSSEDDTFSSDEVVSFILALEAHFYQHFRIKLSVRLFSADSRLSQSLYDQVLL